MSHFTAAELANMRATVEVGFDRTFTITRETAVADGLLGTSATPATIGTSTGKVISATTGSGAHRSAGGDQARTRHEWEIHLEWDANVRDGDTLASTGETYRAVGVAEPVSDQLRTVVFAVAEPE